MTSITPELISDILGWIYVIAWCLFSYPQIYLNYKLKSAEGFKYDYPFLNLFGFVFYSISYGTAYFNENLPYDHYGLTTVRIHDVIFAFHNCFVNMILVAQGLYYPRGKNTLSLFAKIFVVFAWISIGLVYLFTEVYRWIPISADFNVLMYMGYLKITISLVKYIPVAYWNFKRKSTRGFSVISVLLDIVGSTASLSQNVLDWKDGTTEQLSPLKMTLGIICAIYDVILLLQHYVFYGPCEPQRISSFTQEIKTAKSEITLAKDQESGRVRLLGNEN